MATPKKPMFGLQTGGPQIPIPPGGIQRQTGGPGGSMDLPPGVGRQTGGPSGADLLGGGPDVVQREAPPGRRETKDARGRVVQSFGPGGQRRDFQYNAEGQQQEYTPPPAAPLTPPLPPPIAGLGGGLPPAGGPAAGATPVPPSGALQALLQPTPASARVEALMELNPNLGRRLPKSPIEALISPLY